MTAEPAASWSTRVASHCRSASRAAAGVPAPRCSEPSVRKSCCAIALLLYLLMSRTTSASGGDVSTKLGGATGAVPSRTTPVIVPPISRHSPSSMRSL